MTDEEWRVAPVETRMWAIEQALRYPTGTPLDDRARAIVEILNGPPGPAPEDDTVPSQTWRDIHGLR